MIEGAIKYLRGMINEADGVHEVDGVSYSAGAHGFSIIKAPMAEALSVHTLTALRAYLDSDVSEVKVSAEDKLLIHVASPDDVTISRLLTDKTRQREQLMWAKRYGDTFNFGNFMSQENFAIELQSKFKQSAERDSLLKIAGNITDTVAKTSQDDGVTQQVTAKAGVARLEGIDLPNPVTLIPHRTFPEVDQPESQFIFRIRSEGQGVGFALFGADNENWKLKAINNVAAWLKKEIKREDIVILS